MNSKQTLKLTALTPLLLLLPGAHDGSAQSVRRRRLVRGAGAAGGVLRPGTREARHAYAFRAKAGQRLARARDLGPRPRGRGGRGGGRLPRDERGGEPAAGLRRLPLRRPREWAGALPRGGLYGITVSAEDGPDDPGAATLRRMKLSLRDRLTVALRRRAFEDGSKEAAAQSPPAPETFTARRAF